MIEDESTEELETSLREFHEDLVNIQNPNAKTLELIAQVRADLNSLHQEEDDDGIMDRIEDAAAEFSAEHPVLAGNLRRVANLLSGMGI